MEVMNSTMVSLITTFPLFISYFLFLIMIVIRNDELISFLAEYESEIDKFN